MVKFGHNFPKLQKEEWKEEYLNYKLLKHYIKVEKNKNEKIDQKELIRTFINMLNKEIKKVYLFYVQQEREIYIMINSHLHIRNTYDTMNSQSINSEVSELIKIIKLAYDLLSYIKANMTGVQKILKKFDKKFHEEIKGKIRDKFLNDKLSNLSFKSIILLFVACNLSVNLIMQVKMPLNNSVFLLILKNVN